MSDRENLQEDVQKPDIEGQKLEDIIAAFEGEKRRRHAGKIHQGIRKKFAAGNPRVNLNRMIGYDLADDGRTWVVNEEQAEIVRCIFRSYAEGESANQIAKKLNEAGARTVNGSIWRADAIMEVLRNEKYVGDIEMQKTVSIRSRQPVENTGQAPRYYAVNHHAAIIDRDLWDRVQAMIHNFTAVQSGSGKKTGRRGTVFGSLTCGECGGRFQRFGYSRTIDNYTDERSLAAEGITGETAAHFSEKYVVAYSVLRCEKKYRGREGKRGRLSAAELAECDGCPGSMIFHESVLEQSFMEMLYRMKREYQAKGEDCPFAQDFRDAYRNLYESMGGAGAYERRIDALDNRIRTLKEQLEITRERYDEILREAPSQTSSEAPSQTSSHVPSQVSSHAPESVADAYAKRLDDIRQTMARCEEEKEKREEEWSVAVTMKENYDFFVRCLLALPEKNKAGERLNVFLYGSGVAKADASDVAKADGSNVTKIDASSDTRADRSNVAKADESSVRKAGGNNIANVDGSVSQAAAIFDWLPFDKSMYLTFFPKGIVRREEIEFSTSFGIKVRCLGCGRKPEDFLGFRRVMKDGRSEPITGIWQLGDRKIQYRRSRVGL